MKTCSDFKIHPTKEDFQELKQLQAVLDFEIERFQGKLKSGTVEDLINDLTDATK